MTKYNELMNAALDMLEDNDDLFCELVEELDSWNGFAGGFRCYYMSELDDLFCGCSLSDFLNKIDEDSFDLRDEFLIDTIYGLQTTNDRTGHYRDNVDAGDLLDNVRDYRTHLWINDTDFEALLDEIDEAETEDEDEALIESDTAA